MNYSSQSRLSARIAAALALALGSAAAVAQSTGTSSSTGYSNPNPQTTGSTSGAAAGSYGTQADTSRRDDASARDRATVYDAETTTTVGAPTGRETTMTRDKLSFGDRRFVTKACDAGMSEVALSQLAAERASNPEVRRFAEKAVQDHSMMNNELTSIASTKNVKLDDDDGKDRHYKRLANKSGADFDQEYLEHMIDSHEQGVKNFEKASQNAKDTELRAFASKHVGHLREHLQMAQSLRSSVMPTGRTDTEVEVRTEDATGTKRTDTPPNPSQDYDSGTTKSRSGASTDTDTAPRSDDASTDPNRRRG